MRMFGELGECIYTGVFEAKPCTFTPKRGGLAKIVGLSRISLSSYPLLAVVHHQLGLGNLGCPTSCTTSSGRPHRLVHNTNQAPATPLPPSCRSTRAHLILHQLRLRCVSQHAQLGPQDRLRWAPHTESTNLRTCQPMPPATKGIPGCPR